MQFNPGNNSKTTFFELCHFWSKGAIYDLKLDLYLTAVKIWITVAPTYLPVDMTSYIAYIELVLNRRPQACFAVVSAWLILHYQILILSEYDKDKITVMVTKEWMQFIVLTKNCALAFQIYWTRAILWFCQKTTQKLKSLICRWESSNWSNVLKLRRFVPRGTLRFYSLGMTLWGIISRHLKSGPQCLQLRGHLKRTQIKIGLYQSQRFQKGPKLHKKFGH